jgi:hypothetical protein
MYFYIYAYLLAHLAGEDRGFLGTTPRARWHVILVYCPLLDSRAHQYLSLTHNHKSWHRRSPFEIRSSPATGHKIPIRFNDHSFLRPARVSWATPAPRKCKSSAALADRLLQYLNTSGYIIASKRPLRSPILCLPPEPADILDFVESFRTFSFSVGFANPLARTTTMLSSRAESISTSLSYSRPIPIASSSHAVCSSAMFDEKPYNEIRM